MRKMGLSPDMNIAEAIELFPQTLPMFQQLGMCCVNPDNENMTVEEICLFYHVEPESFIEAVNTLI